MDFEGVNSEKQEIEERWKSASTIMITSLALGFEFAAQPPIFDGLL